MVIGLFGKLPSHGDFVRRHLPESFVRPWDDWLQAGIIAARQTLGHEFDGLARRAPAWRFRLPRGACGQSAVAGILLPSQDIVGRFFPLTVGAVFSDDSQAPCRGWYDALARGTPDGLDARLGADSLLANLASFLQHDFAQEDVTPAEGWWTDADLVWSLPALPAPAEFYILMQGGA